MTISAILKEMKDLPADRLDELYQFVHSLNISTKPTDTVRKKILSFGGVFSNMSEKDYSAFVKQTKK